MSDATQERLVEEVRRIRLAAEDASGSLRIIAAALLFLGLIVGAALLLWGPAP